MKTKMKERVRERKKEEKMLVMWREKIGQRAAVMLVQKAKEETYRGRARVQKNERRMYCNIGGGR